MFARFFTLIGAAMIAAVLFSGCPRKRAQVETPVESWNSVSLQKGETLEIGLRRLGLKADEVMHIIETLLRVDFPFRRCLPGDSLLLVKQDDKPAALTYRQNPMVVWYLDLARRPVSVSMKLPRIERKPCLITGVINSTLYESMLKGGETPDVVMIFAEIFAWEIDFTTETQNGDSFFMYVEKEYCDSTFLRYGHSPVLRYKGQVGDYFGVHFEDSSGYDDYYNLNGESLRKSLLKSPLKYSHISSYFSKARFHPILKIWRPHHGLDYSAPTGTPVSTIGDGTVVFKGWKGGYGNCVDIRHANGYKTRYGHLSRFAANLSRGKRVKMGELIGYVGSTGLSTGPHLHFELHKDGVPINPLTVKLPRAPSVKKDYLEEFAAVRDSVIRLLEPAEVAEAK